MLDKNGILASLLQSMRQRATSEVCQMLRDIADEIDVESEPLEAYGREEELEGFDAVWLDR